MMFSPSIDSQRWAHENFGHCVFGDARRTKRCQLVAQRIAEYPAASFPEMFESWSDLKAAYDLFDMPTVTLASVTAQHREQVCDRSPGRYLVISDTTDVDFGYHRDIEGTAPTGNGWGNGFLLHSALLVAAESEVLIGLAGQAAHYRRPLPKKENTTQRLQRPRESDVWGQVVDQVGPPPRDGVQWVHVMDRGADNFEVYCHLLEQRSDWVVRVTQKQRRILTPAGKERPLQAYLKSLPEAGSYQLHLRSREGRPARTAKLKVSFGPLRMPPPVHQSPYVKQQHPAPIPLWVIQVQEVDPPRGVKPLHWILYTSLPVETLEDAWEAIGYYEQRWLIEEWHKALKTGCRLTERQLETADRLEAMTGLLSVVAVRLVQLKTIARHDGQRPAREVVPGQWITMLTRVRPKLSPSEKLTIHQFYRELAMLGGFLGRKHDGEPGWLTIWRGWQKLHLMLRGARAYRAQKYR
jgi:hypothetical protein